MYNKLERKRKMTKKELLDKLTKVLKNDRNNKKLNQDELLEWVFEVGNYGITIDYDDESLIYYFDELDNSITLIDFKEMYSNDIETMIHMLKNNITSGSGDKNDPDYNHG